LGIGSYSAAGVVAIVWASWHLPYIRELTWVYSSEPLTTFIPRFYLLSFFLALVFGEIRMITGTFWPAVLMPTQSGTPLDTRWKRATSRSLAESSISATRATG
jgi:hypothetical protein